MVIDLYCLGQILIHNPQLTSPMTLSKFLNHLIVFLVIK